MGRPIYFTTMRTVQPHFPSTSVIRCPPQGARVPGGESPTFSPRYAPHPLGRAGSVLNPTLGRLERDFMRAIHSTQESGDGYQKEIAKNHSRSGPGALVSVPVSELCPACNKLEKSF
jgi:hypothetical protein